MLFNFVPETTERAEYLRHTDRTNVPYLSSATTETDAIDEYMYEENIPKIAGLISLG